MNQSLKSDSVSKDTLNGYTSLDDAALMRLVKTANHDAFSVLVRRHTHNLLSLSRRTLANKSDAEDVVQSVFIKLWQRPDSWQADKSALNTWLYRVVLNACYDHSRAASTRSHAELSSDHVSLSPNVSDHLSDAEQEFLRNQRLASAMAKLPSSQRDAINLAVFAELPQKQVAQVLGVSVKAVESLLVRAKRKLKNMIGGESNADSSDKELK